VYNTLAMFESPVQIMVVLIIALIVFGPKRLPELGKQLGTGLRELNKAKNDLMRSMNTDYEPDPEPYKDSYTYPPANDTAYSNSYNYNDYTYNAPPDLTDYTIAGQAPKITAAEHSVARSAELEAAESADYSLNHSAANGAQDETSTSAHAADHGSEPAKQGETHV
jgi:TatA/E family protein of Tat protein translocase